MLVLDETASLFSEASCVARACWTGFRVGVGKRCPGGLESVVGERPDCSAGGSVFWRPQAVKNSRSNTRGRRKILFILKKSKFDE
jgi:hypothetical protein